MAMTLPKHLLRFGTNKEQSYFSAFQDCYDGIAINGNIVAHTPGALARFVGQVTTNKPFVIDPQTHAFQHNPQLLQRDIGEGSSNATPGLKVSISKMSRLFGEPVSSKAGVEPLVPGDFEDTVVSGAFCQRVIDFQTRTLDLASEDEDYKQYLKYAKMVATVPCIVVAPYFYMRSMTLDAWLPVNALMVEEAAKQKPTKPLYAQVVIGQDVLSREHLCEKLQNTYAKAKCEGVCLWIDDLDEHDGDELLLNRIGQLGGALISAGKSVHIVYGGYFSAILTRLGYLSGFCHGLEYGESRAVVPVGGGLPMAKYYFPPLHRRLRYRDVTSILEAKGWDSANAFHENVCDCETCREVIAGDIENFAQFGLSKPVTFTRRGQTVTMNYPLPETQDICLKHYLRTKRREIEFLEKSDGKSIIGQLEKAQSDFECRLGDELAFCQTWTTVIKAL